MYFMEVVSPGSNFTSHITFIWGNYQAYHDKAGNPKYYG